MYPDVFHRMLVDQGFGPFTGVPCSFLKELIVHIERTDSAYYVATSEGEAMGIAGGLALAGKLPVVMMQNDGYGNAINPLSSLQLLYVLPALLLITWRAEPGGKRDAVQHHIMGRTLLDLLGIFDIPYQLLDDDEPAAQGQLTDAKTYLEEQKKPYALIVRRGYFKAEPSTGSKSSDVNRPLRIDFIKILAEEAAPSSIILGTTGYTGRELKQVIARSGTFYTAGSMGCIGSIGLGIATQYPERRVYILDGDGALLMKMGTLATIGLYRPRNLVHTVFDNGQYESTGGQRTASSIINIPAIAANSGYCYTTSISTLDEFREFLNKAKSTPGPMMCHIKVQSGTIPDLVRPSESPIMLRDQFMAFLTNDR